MSEKLEILKKKILYRASYIRTKEIDLLLSTFVKKNINLFTESQLKELENFLEFEDETILSFYNFNIVDKNIDKNPISKIFKKFKM